MLTHVAGMEPAITLAMQPFSRGRYSAVIAQAEDGFGDVQKLRGLCFGASGAKTDEFDSKCSQILIRRSADHKLVASFRILALTGETLYQSYSAQHYALESLTTFKGRMLEMGRFCIHPDENDPDILRIAWAVLTAFVDKHDIKLLFGCSSFVGTQASNYQSAFSVLQNRHLAPMRWRPQRKAPETISIASIASDNSQPRKAMVQMPPLLRTYLLMGGWVSDHAVIDRELNTLHVFTGVEVDKIPPARKRLLRATVA